MKIKIYKDKSGQWRWRLLARNGKIIADSAEAYRRKAGAMRAVHKLQVNLVLAEVIEE